MEIKKLISAAIMAAVLMSSAVAMGADEIIFESGKTETGESQVNLDGWGEELLTRCVFEADVQFKGEGSGFMLRSADDTKAGTTIRATDRDGKLTLAADGGNGSFIYYIELDTSAWYHIELFGTYGTNSGMIDMNVGIYDADMNIAETKNYYMILMNDMFASSGVGPEHIRVEPNTVVDNVKITRLMPDAIKLAVPSNMVTAGSEVQLYAKAQRGGEAIDYQPQIVYSADGDGINISPDGLLTIDADAPAQSFTVTAKSGKMTDSAVLNVVSSDIFTINEAGFNTDGTTLEEIIAVKNYFYDDTAAFAAMVYDESGVLRDAFVKYVPCKAVPAKIETSIVLDYTLPADFDADTWDIELYAWSSSDTCSVPAAEGSVAMRRFFEENGGAVEWIGDRRTVVGMLNGKTAVLQIDNPTVYINSAAAELASAPYLENDTTFIPAELIKLISE